MRNAPFLASKTLSPGHGCKVSRTFLVEGGLHYLKGNSAPYFSLTYTAHRKGFPNQCESGGADHDEILRHFPRFADLAALHLSDINGVPMHAEENGWYAICESMKPRWKREAEACITKHGLRVYGDEWSGAEEGAHEGIEEDAT